MLIRLVYVSSAVRDLTADDLKSILLSSRRNNQRRQVTGMLLYAGGNFLQVVEGEQAVVHELYQIIERDPRHHGAIVIDEEPIERRAFAQWSMGFRHLSAEDKQNLVGFTDFLERPVAAEEFLLHRDDVVGLLYNFAKTNSR